MICNAPASLNTHHPHKRCSCSLWIRPALKTQPNGGPAAQLTAYHMPSVFLSSITVCQDLTREFWMLPRRAIPTTSFERFQQFARATDTFQCCMSSLLCISADYCSVETACPSPISPALVQASLLPWGHMWGRAILHGSKSKTQSCSSQESMRIFAFGTFMETRSCPKHIPRELIFQKYEFFLPHTKTFIVRPGSTPQQNIGKRKLTT